MVPDEQFAERVTLLLAIPYDRVAAVAEYLRELSAGRIALEECWTQDEGVWAKPLADGA
jgi:hypothetical protein